jgi:hypothetical protein
LAGSGAGIGVAGKDADPKAWQSHVERSRTPPGAARASQRGRTLADAALDVERAELRLDRRQRGVDLGAVADVGDDRQALAGELRGQLRGALVEVDHRDPGTVGGEPDAGRLADPGAAPGDRRDLALEARHQKFDFSQLVR